MLTDVDGIGEEAVLHDRAAAPSGFQNLDEMHRQQLSHFWAA